MTGNHSSVSIASDQVHGNKRRLDKKTRIAIYFALAVLVLAYLPSLVFHVADLWARSHYRFVPFLIPGVAILAIPRLRKEGSLRPRVYSTIAFLSFCWCLLLLAVIMASPWLGMVGALCLIAAAIWGYGGSSLFRRLWAPWALLWLAVPLPLDYDDAMISTLQSSAAWSASAVLDQLGLLHVLVGNVLEVGGRRLMVEEACSGAHSFFALVPMTIFFVLWRKRPVVIGLLLVAAAATWVLIANITRIVAITVITSRTGIDVTQGWDHEVLGLVVFAAAVGLVLSTDRLLLFLASVRIRQQPKYAITRNRPKSRTNEPRPLNSRRAIVAASAVLIVAYGLLAIGQVAFLWRNFQDDRFVLAQTLAIQPLGAEALPEKFRNWTRVDYSTEHRNRGSDSGEFSQIWRYRFHGHAAQVSLDYPFKGWHELSHCYRTQGWNIRARMIEKNSGKDTAELVDCVTVELSKPFGPNGCLLFAVFDAAGQPLQPKETFSPKHSFFDRLSSRIGMSNEYLSLRRRSETLEDRLPTYQLQLFIATDVPLTAAEQHEAKLFLTQAANQFAEQLRPAKASSPKDRTGPRTLPLKTAPPASESLISRK